MEFSEFEVVTSEERFDSRGSYRYASIAAWEDRKAKQRNRGVDLGIDGQIIKAQLANNFIIRYRFDGVDLNGQPPRDVTAETIECVERYLARIARSTSYQQKVIAKPDRQGTTLNLQVAAGADDAEERSDDVSFSSTATTHNHAQFGVAGWFVGMRFTSVTIPQGSTIDGADWSVYRTSLFDDWHMDVHCEDVDDADDFSTTADVVNRTLTTAFTNLDQDNWGSGWSPGVDVASSVQEVIDRAGWSSGNAICVITDSTEASTYTSRSSTYDNSSSQAAKLDIDYTAAAAGGPPQMSLTGVGK